MTTFDLKKKIETEYSWYTNEHYNEPNVAYVRVQWNGDDEPEDAIQTIVMDLDWYDGLAAENGDDYVVPFIRDEEVLYYASGIESVLELCDGNGYHHTQGYASAQHTYRFVQHIEICDYS